MFDVCHPELVSSRESIQTKLSGQHNGSDWQQYHNQNRDCTFVVKMRSNGISSLEITFHVFRNYLSGRLKHVHDCCTLQSRSVNRSSETFDTSIIQKAVDESEENDELDRCKTTVREELINNIGDKSYSSPFGSKTLKKRFCLRLTTVPIVHYWSVVDPL